MTPTEAIDVTIPPLAPIAVDVASGPAGPPGPAGAAGAPGADGAPRTLVSTSAVLAAASSLGSKIYLPVYEDTKVVAWGVLDAQVAFVSTGQFELRVVQTGGTMIPIETLTVGAGSWLGKNVWKTTNYDVIVGDGYSAIVVAVNISAGTSTQGVFWVATEKL